MPVHDWTRVDDGIFHDFHTVWIGNLRTALNSGLLPPDYYALAEQTAGSTVPDVLTLHASRPPIENGAPDVPRGAVALAEAPPRVEFTMEALEDVYVQKQNTLVIRHVRHHQVIALVEIVSAGNKSSKHALEVFVDKALSALDQGIHLLIIDLHPPGNRDPQGIHGVLWENLTGKPYTQPANKPLTLCSYKAGLIKTSYVQPTAVGLPLDTMPLFLTPDYYVNVDLEPTYQAAYRGVPHYYRNILEA